MNRAITIALLYASAASAAVDGVVMNRTTDKPQPGATVTLYKLGQNGLESVESVKSDAAGKFRIDQNLQGPRLVQTAYDGVTYNHMLPPNAPVRLNGILAGHIGTIRLSGARDPKRTVEIDLVIQ